MNAIFIAAKEVCDFMKARRWKFCVIGGLEELSAAVDGPEIVLAARRLLEGKPCRKK